MSVKYGGMFLVLASATTIAAVVADHWVSRALAVNVALAFMVVAVAYLGGGARLFLKGADGSRSLACWPLLWPYFALNASILWLFRAVAREPAFTLVAPNLYLGRRLTAMEVRQAEGLGWQAVLDLAVEFAEVKPLRQLPGYLSLPVLDATAPSWQQLQDAVSWLEEQVIRGPVLVHCALGHGRSATVVVAYLLSAGHVASINEGLTLLRTQRSGVGLQPSQLALLQRYVQFLAAGSNDPKDPRCTEMP